MNKDDVIRMARDAGMESLSLIDVGYLERFAELVAAAERRKHQADIEAWKAQAAMAEKWRALALAKDPMQPGKVVQEIQREAAAYEREACAQLCEQSDRYQGSYFAKKIRERGEK